MTSEPTAPWPGASSSDERILGLASLFEIEFSIDWIQDLSKAKATTMLMTLERACREKLLKRKELGIFYFPDQKKKDLMNALIPQDQREELRRQIAGFMLNEGVNSDQAIMSAADQLIRVSNDLEGCKILLNAGDRYRKKGVSEKALTCYKKIIQDLKDKSGKQVDLLFIKTVIGYSKDRLSISTPEVTNSLLKKALKRSEKLNDTSFQAILLLHLASLEYQQIKYVSAQRYFYKGQQLSQDISDPAVQRTLDACSVIHYCYSGRFKDAVKKYESIGSIFSKKAPGQRLSLKFGIFLGLSYAYIGQIPLGLGLMNQLRDDALATNDQDAAARASIHIAWVLIMKNDLENAATKIKEALTGSPKMDLFTKRLASLLKAVIYFEKSEIKKSHDQLKKTLQTRNKYSFTLRGHLFEFCLAMERGTYPAIPELSIEDEINMSIDMGNLHNQGMAYRYKAIRQQDKNEPHENVFKNLNKSLSLLKKSGGIFEVAKTKETLARYFLKQNNLPKAKECVETAAKIFQKYGEQNVADDLKHLSKNFHLKDVLFEELLNFGPDVLEIRDIKNVTQQILSTVIKITQAERGAIFLYPGKLNTPGIELLAGKNLAMEDIEKPDFKQSIQMILETAKTGQDKLGIEDSQNKKNLKDDAIKSRICVPLLRRGETIGVLYHDNRLFQSTFKKQDLKILSYFASLAAIALDNAHAYEKIQSLNQRLSEEKNYLVEQQQELIPFDDFIAVSPAIKKVLTLVSRVADTEANVLILGDTGVGKEMVARAIHHQSSRKDKPFIRVNCNAFSENLIASELFGHEKDAFTGADKRRIGRFELADKGTLFLDEIGDISMDIQVRLLRVLQTKKFERVGDSQSIQSDFRLLAATNINLEKAVQEGRFRQDLFYRLNVFPVYVPPLRERMEGLPSLANYFLKKHSDRLDKSFREIPEKEMNKLLRYHWPGNVRELENVIERGVILNTEDPFSIPELSMECKSTPPAGQFTLEEMERRFILDTIQKVNWKIHGPGGAAELLGMNHSTLYSRMKKLGLQNPNKKS